VCDWHGYIVCIWRKRSHSSRDTRSQNVPLVSHRVPLCPISASSPLLSVHSFPLIPLIGTSTQGATPRSVPCFLDPLGRSYRLCYTGSLCYACHVRVSLTRLYRGGPTQVPGLVVLQSRLTRLDLNFGNLLYICTHYLHSDLTVYNTINCKPQMQRGYLSQAATIGAL
jgi:hypothetical protein